MNAREIWARKHPATVALSRDERACAAMREIERLRDAITGLQHEIDTTKPLKNRPRWLLTVHQKMLVVWAEDDLASTQAELEAILKE